MQPAIFTLLVMNGLYLFYGTVFELGNKLTVMLATEGTYPFFQGGVSTWCDMLIQKLANVDYVIYSVVTDPFLTPLFPMPKHAQVNKLPLWGTEEPSEHLNSPFVETYISKKKTTSAIVNNKFLPLFIELVEELVAVEKSPKRFGQIIFNLYRYFQEYEYKESFKSELTWRTYKDIVMACAAKPELRLPEPDIYGLIQSLGWTYRFFTILNNPVPRTHVSHTSAAAFCGIPAVLGKFERRTPILLTEHGVYLREQYLSLSKRGLAPFLNTFLIRLVSAVVHLNYAFADQVSPVCAYNTRWEKRLGVDETRIKVIHNGVDERIFSTAPRGSRDRPTVVTVARIDPYKDILSLIRSARIVKDKIPNVQYVVYGSVAVPSYFEECLELRDQLDLTDTVIFAGHTENMASAYQSGDVIALSSITEAFPYAVVEGMMSGKPVVATDVGGIREALGDTGYIVTPGDSEELAASIMLLLKNPALREKLGAQARERALELFTLRKVLEHHLKSYVKLAVHADEYVPAAASGMTPPHQLQKLHAEQAYLLKAQGYYAEALSAFRSAANANPMSATGAVLLGEIAECYQRLGDGRRARMELDRMKLVKELVVNQAKSPYKAIV